MDKKKLIISLGIIGGIAAVVIGGTIAYFSDIEESTGNTFTAGNLDLKVDSECSYNGVPQQFCTWALKDLETGNLFFNYDDVKPGDYGEDTISLHIDYNDAYVCAGILNLESQENGCNNPEKITEPNCEQDEIGELQNNLLFTVWKDTDCDNVLDAGVPEVLGSCNVTEPDPSGVGQTVCPQLPTQVDCEYEAEQGFYGCVWIPGTAAVPAEQVLVQDQPATNGIWPIADSNTGGPLEGDETYCIGVSWRIPGETGNEIQTDKLTADVSFEATQSRNIPQFICTPQGGCIPKTEVCNDGLDNDCDGNIDCADADCNGQACDDGLYCNGADTCSAGACAGHTGNPCPGPDGDSDCRESCNEASDNCTAFDPIGSFCDDGLYCTGINSCNVAGNCAGSGNPCPGPDGDSDCSESCNETADNCTANDQEGASCLLPPPFNTTGYCHNGNCIPN
jgi:predicted ribosomally synthesized peptide with SipW-like signal peptide